MTAEVTVIHGDCLDVLPTLDAGSIDAVVTDPPWMDYETGRYDASPHHGSISVMEPESYAGEFFRVMRDASVLVLWCRWDCFERHAAAVRMVGFRVRNCIVWAKPNHTAGDLDGNLGSQHEMAVFATKGDWKRHGPRDVNLWLEPHLFSKTKRHHPTEKSLSLMSRAVRLACPIGGLVLDPFAGSGTTLLACLKTGRRGIGIEVDPRYIPIIHRRLESAATPLFAGIEEP